MYFVGTLWLMTPRAHYLQNVDIVHLFVICIASGRYVRTHVHTTPEKYITLPIAIARSTYYSLLICQGGNN